jgi:tetratricopeptide (TPR) repeat protein
MVLISPLACTSQSSNQFAAGTAAPNPSSAVVSVHELQIPEKARKDCEKGTKRFAAKDSAGSIPEFQKAIQSFPGYYEAYAKLGAAEFDLERWDDAESAFRKAMELSGGHYAPADFGLGLILATVTKKFADAEEVVRAGLEKAPTDVAGHFVLAWVLYSTARLQEAEDSVRQALVTDPNAAAPRLLLAQIHLRQNKFSAAVEDLNTYLASGVAGPMDEKARTARAEALRALGNTEAEAPLSTAASQ